VATVLFVLLFLVGAVSAATIHADQSQPTAYALAPLWKLVSLWFGFVNGTGAMVGVLVCVRRHADPAADDAQPV
jgi:hypothetical protein